MSLIHQIELTRCCAPHSWQYIVVKLFGFFRVQLHHHDRVWVWALFTTAISQIESRPSDFTLHGSLAADNHQLHYQPPHLWILIRGQREGIAQHTTNFGETRRSPWIQRGLLRQLMCSHTSRGSIENFGQK